LATTFIKPIRASKGKTAAQTMIDSLDYIMNPKKTRGGELTAGYECDPRTAATEFLMSKQEYSDFTGKERKRNVLLYHMRQSFKPGEITPEEATKIGYELAMRWTKGKHSFVVAAHEDKEHIHCHIMFNAVNTGCTKKFYNFWGSSFAVRRLSDIICLENGLSIVKDPKPSKGHYGTWLGDKKEPSQKIQLEQLIDKVLAGKPPTFEDFIKLLEAENCKFKRDRRSVCLPGKKGFHRLNGLSEDYTEAAIRERIEGKRTTPQREKAPRASQQKFNLLIDVQNSIKAQNSPGYERWAKTFSLKQAAKTLLFLEDNNLDDLEKLSDSAQKAKDDFNDIQTRIHAADARMKDITLLQKHIGTYIKTKDIYAGYKKSKFSKKFRSENEKALADHKAAKAYFDELKLDKLPTISMLKQEYAALSAEKKKLYGGYSAARNYMQEILMAQQNVHMLLNHQDHEQTKTQNREGR
jgi:hypothetical protein